MEGRVFFRTSLCSAIRQDDCAIFNLDVTALLRGTPALTPPIFLASTGVSAILLAFQYKARDRKIITCDLQLVIKRFPVSSTAIKPGTVKLLFVPKPAILL